MKSESSHSHPGRQSPKAASGGLLRLAVYGVVVFGLAVLFYNLLLHKMWLVPVLAECVLIRSPWITGPFWKPLAGRLAALATGNALAYFLYVIPVVYDGQQPWSEEPVWAYLTVAAQTAVAAVVLLARRLLLRRQSRRS